MHCMQWCGLIVISQLCWDYLTTTNYYVSNGCTVVDLILLIKYAHDSFYLTSLCFWSHFRLDLTNQRKRIFRKKTGTFLQALVLLLSPTQPTVSEH